MSEAEAPQRPKSPAETRGARRSAQRRVAARKVPRGGGAEAKVDLGPLDNYIAFHLRLAQELALRAFAKRSGKADFRPGWFAILMVIHLNPGISQSALSRAIGRDKSTLSPLIRELQARALILRRPSVGDRRSVTLSLTKAGQGELEALSRHGEAHDRRLDEIVGEDKPKLIAMLRKIAVAFA